MRNIALCHAPDDDALARELAGYLALNLDAHVEQVPASPWLDLIEAVETAADADTVISILSPAAVPERWPRERWDAIRGPNSVWVLAGACPYPPLLERRAFFDLRVGLIGACRAIRRWILAPTSAPKPAPEFEPHFMAFVDRPGAAVVEDPSIIAQVTPYFETVCTVDSCCRTPVSLISELAHLLGLDSSAELYTLFAAVQEHLNTHRLLLLLNGDEPAQPLDPGRASIVRIPIAEHRTPADPPAMMATLDACQKGRAEAPTRADLDRSITAAFASAEWHVVRELAQSAYGFLKNEYRLAEASDVLDRLKAASLAHGDYPVQYECVREEAWIAERWAGEAEPSGARPVRQISFFW